MKKYLLSFAALTLAFAFLFTSCKEKKKQKEEQDVTPVDTTTVTPAEDFTGYTQLTFAEGVAYPTKAYADVTFANSTDTIIISFNLADGTETLPAANYTVDEDGSYEAGTFDPDYSAIYLEDSGWLYIEGGTVKVTKSGRKYTVKLDITDEDGETYKYYYQGAIEIEVYNFEPQTEFEFTWDDFDTDWTYYTYVEDYSLYVMVLTLVDEDTGWEIDLAFTTSATDPAGVMPAGEYSMLTSSNITGNSIIPGYTSGNNVGGSYATDWNSGFGLFQSGDMTITVTGGNTTLEGEFADEDGNTYTVSVSGATPTLTYKDNSADPAPARRGAAKAKRFVRK